MARKDNSSTSHVSSDEPQSSQTRDDAGNQITNASNEDEKRTDAIDKYSTLDGNINQCDYDQDPTLLYQYIDDKQWTQVLERCNQAPTEVSTWVVRYDKKSKVKTLRWRLLPIHASIMFNAPLKVIAALHNAYKEGLQCADDRKMLPVHLACRVVSNMNVTTYLIYNSSSLLQKGDYKGRTPLLILKEYRDKAERKKPEGYEDDIRIRETLMKMIRTNKLQPNSDDGGDGENGEIISESSSLGLSAHSSDSGSSQEQGPTPLTHRIYSLTVEQKLERQKKVHRVKRTIDMDACVQALESGNQSYPTVLFKLVEHKMWEQVVTRCIDVPEEASRWMRRTQQIKAGRKKKEVQWKILPIHSAIVLHAPVEVIEALIDAYPRGLEKGDDRKMLPLHMAFRLGTSTEVVAVLMDSFPDALTKKDSKGHTPLHILKAYSKKYEKEKAAGKSISDSTIDKNRKDLIQLVLPSQSQTQSKAQG